MTPTNKPSKAQLTKIAWRTGNLKYKLKPHQRPIYERIWETIQSTESNSYVINCARRFGKSFILLLVCIEFCIRFPNSQVRYAIPIATNYTDMLMPSINFIIEDAPKVPKVEDGQPVLDQEGHQIIEPFVVHFKSEKRLVFANGSMIKIAGTDNGNAENLRGNASHLNVLDEAGFMDDLDYVYKSILFPQTWTTGGKTLFSSTPPPNLDHYYVQLYNEHLEKGLVSQYTIYDNTSLKPHTIDSIIREYNGEQSTEFQREALCKFVGDEQLLITPEWNELQPDGAVDHPYIKEHPRHPQYFQFYHKYESLDSGVRDLTICLFGYYDYEEGKLVIENECHMNGPELTTEKFSELIKKTEAEIWEPQPKVHKRIADSNNLHLIQDLSRTYNLPFFGTSKEHLIGETPDSGMINKMRVFIGQGRLIVHPRCEQLTGCLKHGRWASKEKIGKLFGRSPTYGHYDATAALCYLIRNLDQNVNPIPPLFQKTALQHHITPGMVINGQNTHVNTQLGKLFPQLVRNK